MIRIIHIDYSNNCTESGNGLVTKCPPKDNSAKLLFNIFNTTSSLWILSTDYSEYIMSYQCSKYENNGIIETKGLQRNCANFLLKHNYSCVSFQLCLRCVQNYGSKGFYTRISSAKLGNNSEFNI